MSHPDVEDLSKVVLLLSNKQGRDRLFVEVPHDDADAPTQAGTATKRLDIGWFDQAWFAECVSKLPSGGATYSLRNLRTGLYLQAGKKQPDGSTSIELSSTSRAGSPKSGLIQRWLITNDNGFARIRNAAGARQAIELIEGQDGVPSRIVLQDNDASDKQTQTWQYERVSRAAHDVFKAMRESNHLPDPGIEYQSTDMCYINLPPRVRGLIWENSGLGSGALVWRNQIFDCDDFAFLMKAAVSKWAAENLKCDEFTILFGVTFGRRGPENDPQSHAYNWYLDWENLSKVVFFEPMTGHQSDDGGNYHGFNGIF